MIDTISRRDTKTADRLEVSNVKHLGGYKLLVCFNDGNESVIDLTPFLSKTKGYLKMYKKPENFAKYRIINGNLAWGKERDLIFPIEQLYNGHIE